MLRFALRFAGVWLFAGALVMAVVDGAKSIAASAPVTTPVADVLAALAATSEPPAGTSATLPWPLDLAVAWFLVAPACAVLAFLGLGLLVVGRRKRVDRHQFVT
jgi:hypothetical protein